MRPIVLLVAVVTLFLAGCSTQRQPTSAPVPKNFKHITQLDLDTNQPVRTWNARADTIHQHVTPPVGISFTDAATGEKVQFNGTYKIESYRSPSPTPQPSASPLGN